MKKTIGFFVGSLRHDSFSMVVAKTFAKLLPAEYTAKFIQIDDLPFYNQDLDTPEQVPTSWRRFRNEVRALDGLIFVTPEYNRSVPAVLKNALDVGSRPPQETVWSGKVGLVLSDSPGGIGGFGANHHLRQTLVFLNVLTLQQPEAYIGQVHKLIEHGEITNEKTIAYFESILAAYLNLLEQNQ